MIYSLYKGKTITKTSKPLLVIARQFCLWLYPRRTWIKWSCHTYVGGRKGAYMYIGPC